MNGLDPGSAYGIGAVALALVGLVWKIWHDSTKQTDRIIDVLEKNALAQESLSRNVKENTEMSKEQSESLRQHTETMMQIMLKVVKNGRNGRHNTEQTP